MEVRTALQNDKRLFPVLIDNTPMPKEQELPDDLKPLTRLNALQLRHDRFDDDLDNISLAALGYKLTARIEQRKRLGLRRAKYVTAGVIGGLAVCVGLAVLHTVMLDRPLSLSIGAAGTTLLILTSAAVGGLVGFVRGAPTKATVTADANVPVRLRR